MRIHTPDTHTHTWWLGQWNEICFYFVFLHFNFHPGDPAQHQVCAGHLWERGKETRFRRKGEKRNKQLRKVTEKQEKEKWTKAKDWWHRKKTTVLQWQSRAKHGGAKALTVIKVCSAKYKTNGTFWLTSTQLRNTSHYCKLVRSAPHSICWRGVGPHHLAPYTQHIISIQYV